MAFLDDSASPNHGITFSNFISLQPGVTGAVKWIQVDFAPSAVYLETNSVTHTQIFTGPAPYGDTPIPYVTFDPASGFPCDDPKAILPAICNRVEASDHFTMWMMFQPSGGIMVPLRAVDWYWHGIATNAPGGWTLASSPSDHSVNPPDYSAEQYPVWNSSVQSNHIDPPF
jgi:hypothetical protein